MIQAASTAAFDIVESTQNSKNVSHLDRDLHRLCITQPNQVWRKKIIDRLEDLTHLSLGWDGYQGKPVSFEIANFSLKIIEAICPNEALPPQIVPGSSGDLQLEWHTPDIDIELHVSAPNKVYAWICNDETGQEGQEHELSIDFTIIAKQIKNMMKTDHAQSAAAG